MQQHIASVTKNVHMSLGAAIHLRSACCLDRPVAAVASAARRAASGCRARPFHCTGPGTHRAWPRVARLAGSPGCQSPPLPPPLPTLHFGCGPAASLQGAPPLRTASPAV
ncbi:hypothetical protein ABPG75_003712 [Micractinium tetrahymenae]